VDGEQYLILPHQQIKEVHFAGNMVDLAFVLQPGCGLYVPEFGEIPVVEVRRNKYQGFYLCSQFVPYILENSFDTEAESRAGPALKKPDTNLIFSQDSLILIFFAR
jgi:hypothetical protein